MSAPTILLTKETAAKLIGYTASFAPGTVFSRDGANTQAQGNWSDESPVTAFTPADVIDVGDNGDNGYWIELMMGGSTGEKMYVFSAQNDGAVFIDPSNVYDSETLENVELMDMSAAASIPEKVSAAVKNFPWKTAAIAFFIGVAVVYLASKVGGKAA